MQPNATSASFADSIRSVADRLNAINGDICGSNHLLIENEVLALRAIVIAVERPAPARVIAENPAPKRAYNRRGR